MRHSRQPPQLCVSSMKSEIKMQAMPDLQFNPGRAQEAPPPTPCVDGWHVSTGGAHCHREARKCGHIPQPSDDIVRPAALTSAKSQTPRLRSLNMVPMCRCPHPPESRWGQQETWKSLPLYTSQPPMRDRKCQRQPKNRTTRSQGIKQYWDKKYVGGWVASIASKCRSCLYMYILAGVTTDQVWASGCLPPGFNIKKKEKGLVSPVTHFHPYNI